MDRFTAAAPSVGALRSDSPQRTRALGRAIGTRAMPGTVLSLIGPLGAGKTQLAKGVADGLEVTSVVNSPTFVLMNEHVGRLRLFHVDAYRLHDPDEALAVGLFEERQAEGVTVVEWADRLDGWLPLERIDLWIEPEVTGEDKRTLRWVAHGDGHAALAAEALAAEALR
jgi:tRNA threonylcarbamoyladenosine biosynthesis protein TsaE